MPYKKKKGLSVMHFPPLADTNIETVESYLKGCTQKHQEHKKNVKINISKPLLVTW